MVSVVKLQQTYWGNDPESVIPAHMLFSIAANGGHILGATDGDTLAGVVIGLLGMSMTNSDRPAAENLLIYSKRMVVHRDYRNHGLGYQLKMAQRDFAIRQGIRRVVWTFDPLLAMNAHLNLRKLRGISRDFRENYYGVDTGGGLSPLGASDRLYLEWWLHHERVVNQAEGGADRFTLDDYQENGAIRVNKTVPNAAGIAVPDNVLQMPGKKGRLAIVEIPHNYYLVMQADAKLALLWREHNRRTLGDLMRRGYVAIDFVKSEQDGRKRAYYILSASENNYN